MEWQLWYKCYESCYNHVHYCYAFFTSVFVGGDVDAASKTLIGVAFTGQGRQSLSNCLIAVSALDI